MDKETNVESGSIEIASIQNKINEFKIENPELGNYLEKIANRIMNDFKSDSTKLQFLLKDFDNLLFHVQELLNLKQTIYDDITYIKNEPTGYNYVEMIELLNNRRSEIYKYIYKLNPNRREDEITDLVNQTLELFANLQMCIISTYVMQKKLVDEINNGMNTLKLWDDNFVDFVIINDDEIVRLKQCISALPIKDTSKKEKISYYLTFESNNIRHSIDLWEIVAENLGIMKFLHQDKPISDNSNIGHFAQNDKQVQENTLNLQDLKNGDLTKLIRNIPLSEKIRLEKEWLNLKGYEDAFKIPDNVIYIPDDKEIVSILVDIIDTKNINIRYGYEYERTMTFLGRDGIQNVLKLDSSSYSIIIIKEHNSTIMDFDRFNIIFFMKEIDTMFPELYLLSDCMDELIKGKKNLWNKLVIHGYYNRKNPKKYSKIFELCDNNFTKLKMLTDLPEMQIDLDKLLESRREYYQKYGIDISKKDKEEKKKKKKNEIKAKASEKTLYQKTKEKYSYGEAIEFLRNLRTNGLSRIEFPEEMRKKMEQILCDLEYNNFSEIMAYIPTNEEIFMTIEAIIKKKCSEDRLAPIRFIDKDGIPTCFEGSNLKSYETYSSGDQRHNANLKYTLNKIERKINILNKEEKCFDSNSICLLWLLDILFETNCLTEYINEMINIESETNPYIESDIYNQAKYVYDSFKEMIKSTKNYQRHKMRWEFNRRIHYGLEEKVPLDAETKETDSKNDVSMGKDESQP